MATIVIDARELRTSTGRYVERLLHYLQKLDHDHEYHVLLKPADMASWEPTNQRFFAVACPVKEFTFAEQTTLKEQIATLKPDLVHFAMTQQPVWYKGTVVTTVHDLTTARFRNPTKNPLVFTFKQQVYKWVIHRVAQKSANILVPSEFVKKDIVNYTHVSPDKIIVTYEAADKITEPPEVVSELEQKQYLLYVGRPQPHKNLSRFIDAFQILKQSYPDLFLVLAGKQDTAYRQLQNYATSKQVGDVVFTGFVSEARLHWLYEHAALYVFPSLSEGFGLPGLEAMQYGVPVAASKATSLPEIYGDAAEYFDPTSASAIAQAVHQVLSEPARAKKLSQKGFEQVKKYSWQRMAEQTLAVYQQVLGEK